MGTEVLYPQDLLSCRDLGSALRKQTCRGSSARNPKLRRKRGERLSEPKIGDNSSALPMIVGQVKILKRGERLEISDVYAGSAFTQSPSPRALPLPKFRSRREEDGEEVDRSATKDLLRLLRLE